VHAQHHSHIEQQTEFCFDDMIWRIVRAEATSLEWRPDARGAICIRRQEMRGADIQLVN
jgi:hypothetical protein